MPDDSQTRIRQRPPVARWLLYAMLAAGGLACGPRQGRDIRIGLLAILDGEYARVSGLPSVNAARLAVRELNDSGGILLAGRRHRVVLMERTHQVRPDAASSEARASINLDHVDVLIGPQLSLLANAAGAVAEESGVPMISPMASNPVVTDGRRYVFRMAFLDAFQGTLLADFARSDLKASRAAVLYNVSLAYSAEVARLFVETFERLGGTVVANESFTTDMSAGLEAQLRRIARANPQVLVLPVRSPTAITALREARRLGISATMLGSDTWDVSTIAPLPEADGAVVVHQWHPDVRRDRTGSFVLAYRTAYDETPRATAALTYDAVHLAADAIARSGSLEGDRIADAITATERFDGASGSLKFAGRHDPNRSGVLSLLRNGSHSLLRIVSSER